MRPKTNPRNPPRPPRHGCPRDGAHSCFHCASTWRCATCSWPLAESVETGLRWCPHCHGEVLTISEWEAVAATGCMPATAPVTPQVTPDTDPHAAVARLLAARAAYDEALEAVHVASRKANTLREDVAAAEATVRDLLDLPAGDL